MKTIKIQKLIEANNLIFKSASSAEKRVLVAKDVLKQINSGKYNAQQMCYVKFSNININEDDPKEISLQNKLLENTTKCKCCAIGGLMLSAIRYTNNVNINKDIFNNKNEYHALDYNGSDKDISSKQATNNIKKIFSNKELRKIEDWFEDFESNMGDKWNSLSPKQRLIKIMKNIIDNNGKFLPSKLT